MYIPFAIKIYLRYQLDMRIHKLVHSISYKNETIKQTKLYQTISFIIIFK